MATTAKRRMTLPFDIGDFANDKPALELITLIHEYARKLIVEHGVNRFESRRKPAELDLSYEDVNQLGAECFQHGKEYLTELLREINLQCIENLRVSLELEMRLAKDYIAHIRPSEHPVYTQNCGGDNGYSTGQPILDVVDGGDYESFLSIIDKPKRRSSVEQLSRKPSKKSKHDSEHDSSQATTLKQPESPPKHLLVCPFSLHTCLPNDHHGNCNVKFTMGSKLRTHLRGFFKAHYCKHCREAFNSSTYKNKHQKDCPKMLAAGVIEVHQHDEKVFAVCRKLSERDVKLEVMTGIVDNYCMARKEKKSECKRCNDLKLATAHSPTVQQTSSTEASSTGVSSFLAAPESSLSFSRRQLLHANSSTLPSLPAYNKPTQANIPPTLTLDANYADLPESPLYAPGDSGVLARQQTPFDCVPLISQLYTMPMDGAAFLDTINHAMETDAMESLPSNNGENPGGFFDIAYVENHHDISNHWEEVGHHSDSEYFFFAQNDSGYGSTITEPEARMSDYPGNVNFRIQITLVGDVTPNVMLQELLQRKRKGKRRPLDKRSSRSYDNSDCKNGSFGTALSFLFATGDSNPPFTKHGEDTKCSLDSFGLMKALRSDYVKEWQRGLATESDIDSSSEAEKEHTSLADRLHRRRRWLNKEGQSDEAKDEGCKTTGESYECLCGINIHLATDADVKAHRVSCPLSRRSWLKRFKKD